MSHARVWVACGALLLTGCAGSRAMQVNVALLDVRAQPGAPLPVGTHDPDQETQLFYGEAVTIKARRDGWARIEAPEQPEFSHGKRWQGYPGWVNEGALIKPEYDLPPTIVVHTPWAKSFTDPHLRSPSPLAFPMGSRLHATDIAGAVWRVELSDGGFVWLPRAQAFELTELRRLSAAQRRPLILRLAAQALGTPYYWGGRAVSDPAQPGKPTGLDCSGLVNVAYRAAGVEVPRDAHEQWMRAQRLAAPQPADLIFLSEKHKPSRIVHVMLYAGNDEVIEAPSTGLQVRRITLRERLGIPLQALRAGAVVNDQTVSFGGYL